MKYLRISIEQTYILYYNFAIDTATGRKLGRTRTYATVPFGNDNACWPLYLHVLHNKPASDSTRGGRKTQEEDATTSWKGLSTTLCERHKPAVNAHRS